MRDLKLYPAAGRRGYASIIGLLVVLLIISYLLLTGYFAPSKNQPNVTQANVYINKSKDAACLSNLGQLKGQITEMIVNNNGQLPAESVLKIRLANVHCPAKGAYQADQQGNVYCSKHQPAAAGTAELVNLD